MPFSRLLSFAGAVLALWLVQARTIEGPPLGPERQLKSEAVPEAAEA
jgi:hypothetical protein